MNNGAFGENFPYSNFHDINMDWIIKIAKDFLDQYTHIQEIIEQGITDINTGVENGLASLSAHAEELETALDEWYNTHSEDIAEQLAQALAQIQTDGTAMIQYANDQIAQKLQEALSVIPSDVEGLQYHLNQIDKEIGYEEKVLKLLPATRGNGVFHFVNKTWNTSAQTYKHLEYTLQGERYLYVTGYAWSSPYGAWGFLDSDGNVISYDNTHATGTPVYNQLVVVPENAVTVIVNAYLDNTNFPEYAYFITTYSDTVRKELDFIPSKNILWEWVDVPYSVTLRHARRITNVDSPDNSGYYYYSIDVTAGETYYIRGWHFSNTFPAYMVFDANNNILIKNHSNNSQSFEIALTMPTGATKLYVNGATYAPEPAYIKNYTSSTLDDLVSIMRRDIDNSHEAWSMKCSTYNVSGTMHDGYAKHNNGSTTASASYMYADYIVEGGKTYLITGHHFANGYPLYILYDENDERIEFSMLGNEGFNVHQMAKTMPYNARKISINGLHPNTDGNGVCNLEAYNDNTTLANLYDGKNKQNILFIGDSYGEGYSHDGNNPGWISYCAQYMQLSETEFTKIYRGGARFSANSANNTFVKLLLESNKPFNQFTDIVVAGGYNDNAYDNATIQEGIANFIATAKVVYPFAKVHIGMCAWNKAGTGEGAIDDWATIHENLLTTVLGAYKTGTVRNGALYMANIEYQLNDSGMTNNDGYHPSGLGNRWLGEAIAQALNTGSCWLPQYMPELRR